MESSLNSKEEAGAKIQGILWAISSVAFIISRGSPVLELLKMYCAKTEGMLRLAFAFATVTIFIAKSVRFCQKSDNRFSIPLVFEISNDFFGTQIHYVFRNPRSLLSHVFHCVESLFLLFLLSLHLTEVLLVNGYLFVCSLLLSLRNYNQ